ncbi:hypothetical protein DPMN_011299 [Dreissena polymorpha]|uniref:Uncharacterized protein n=1 Tax=Dreissena polymorpha TaxID=45954 RepID=A0A9D4N0B2_DREPO|nr:hypothetical protein DPMN_011299 [Dreissena polymorpha]
MIHLLTKFGEDRIEFSGQTDRQTTTDRPTNNGALLPNKIRLTTKQEGTDLLCEAKDVIRTNVLTNFHGKDKFPGSNVFQQTGPFHDDWKINVTLRVKNAPPSGGNVF